MSLDERASRVLTSLVQQYIAAGQPVSSSALVAQAGWQVSSATVRSVMGQLESLGLICSPHTSAGRVPTPMGFRFVVDALLTANAGADLAADTPAPQFVADTPSRMAGQAAQLLSQISQFAGLIGTPRREAVFGQIDFLRLDEARILVVLVAPDGEVQNRLLQVETPFSPSELVAAANYLNTHCAGASFARVRALLTQELTHLQGRINELMQRAVAHSPPEDEAEQLIVKGERHLLDVAELTSNMTRLRQTFDLFDEKTRLLQLLELTREAGSVQVFIGGESSYLPMDGVSLICAPYQVSEHVVGTLGVIGPTRMAYDKVIPMVDLTARVLSRAMQAANHGGAA